MSGEGSSGVSLPAIRERLAKATPAPWSAKDEWVIRSDDDDPYTVAEVTSVDERGGVEHAWADASFIAAAPDTIAGLLAAVDAVLALHRPTSVATVGGTDVMCVHCRNEPRTERDIGWPCPTVRAVAAHVDTKPEGD